MLFLMGQSPVIAYVVDRCGRVDHPLTEACRRQHQLLCLLARILATRSKGMESVSLTASCAKAAMA